MAAGFPVSVSGLGIRTVEALYQACRYPNHPELQREIIEQLSPMAAKMVSRTHADSTRSDWNQVRVRIMRWCLRVKLAHNQERFGQLLLTTDDRPIVEESRHDAFWGAVPVGPDELVGTNVLGRLLMDLRRGVGSGEQAESVDVDPPGGSRT